MRIPRKHLPPGAVREVKQWSLDTGTDEWFWDFAWRDPASGRLVQYNARASVAYPGPSEADFVERVRAPAIACIERDIHRKCGVAYALANQHHLSLPRGVVARFV
jgi:hypothetical protein